ncbi:MAG: isochorismatase family protein [Aureliella sp.]
MQRRRKINVRRRAQPRLLWHELLSSWIVLFALQATVVAQIESPQLDACWALELRDQVPLNDNARFHRRYEMQRWEAPETAVIVCDMWDAHHCLNAVRRATQLAPRINEFCHAVRSRGGMIIHAPSSCTDFYASDPARKRALQVAPADAYPEGIESWCDVIPSEEAAAYPIDQSDGGEDDEANEHQQWAAQLESRGRNPRQPWIRQIASIEIDSSSDYISDQGKEIWSILESRSIKNVILCGVHTNMCVLGRPFGLRRMATGGKNVVLARDLTDTMYNPEAWPYAAHFTGTDLIVDHIERYVCPTSAAIRFSEARNFDLPAIDASDC